MAKGTKKPKKGTKCPTCSGSACCSLTMHSELKTCLICDFTFNKPKQYSRKQWDEKKYCSSKCFGKVLSKLKKGKKPWNYRGISSQNKLERQRFRKEIQKLVFERDDYTCQLCGIRGGVLQVDHIKSWADYVELRFNMENCRTLCVSCHYQITYGRPMPETVSGWGQHFFKGGNLQ